MTPLLACVPVCMKFVAIGIIGAIVVVFGLSNPVPIDDSPKEEGPSRYGATGPPP
ncbi:hypothetical protein [Frigoriglobus tundricola]|uniref:Uncharacterized protein n=1 Tax=Frigoriglobus tundricola TaxID=2774151 RepID=A0A6M5YK02_9BACT|nr:hypothetical protein [Frigoriglobus tundricola]QJW93593.1 hypothetical protein FTUN_1100 [Frigoriglobus tundricola]